MSNGDRQPGNGMPPEPDTRALDALMLIIHFFKWLFGTDTGRGFLVSFLIFCLVAGILGMIIGPNEPARNGYPVSTVQESRPQQDPMRFQYNDGRQVIQVPRQDQPSMQIPQGATGGCITVNNMTECSWTRSR